MSNRQRIAFTGLITGLMLSLLLPGVAYACTAVGMFGVTFGQPVNSAGLEIYEQPPLGNTYYVYSRGPGIQPFAKLIVGVLPNSRKVWVIDAELHGDKPALLKIIEETKIKLGDINPEIKWRVDGNYHYGESTDVDITLYTLGDFKRGKATHLLTYSCEHNALAKQLFKEARSQQSCVFPAQAAGPCCS